MAKNEKIAIGQAKPKDEAFEREVLYELIQMHANANLFSPLVTLLLVIGVVSLVRPSVAVGTWLGWGVLAMAADCFRAVYAWRILKRGLALQHILVHQQFIYLAGIVGFLLGLSAVLFLPFISLFDQALLGVILCAAPAAAMAVGVSSQQMLIAYTFFVLSPAAFAVTVHNPPEWAKSKGPGNGNRNETKP